MWYFTWVLGLLLACSFGIINAMWLELHVYKDGNEQDTAVPEARETGN